MSIQPSPRYAPGWADASPGSVAFGIILVTLSVIQLAVTGWASATGPTTVFLAVPLLAVAVGVLRFREPTRGPDLHDRQLDRIVATGAMTAAATLLALSDSSSHRLDLLALPATAAAVLASRYGTRRLWHLRGAVVTPVLLWPTPWLALAADLDAHLPAAAVQAGLVGLVVAVPFAMTAHGARLGRVAAVPVAVLAAAAIGMVLADVNLAVAVPAATALAILAGLVVRLLGSIGWTPTPETV